MKRNFFDFGDQSALVGALAVVAFVLAANLGYYIAREFGRNSEPTNQQTTQNLNQDQQNNRP